MNSRKVKVFLVSYVNVTQAQCLNCRALALHLDREKFAVGVRAVYDGDLEDESIRKLPQTKLFQVRYPGRIWEPIQFVRGLLWCDIAYLPSPKHWWWARRLLGFLGKKSFTTIEGVISGVAYDRAVAVFGSVRKIREFYFSTTKTFAITKAMIKINKDAIALPEPDGVLYLGTDYDKFAAEKHTEKLTDVILVGSDLKRKGIDDYLVLAKRFPQITFQVVGGTVGGVDYKKKCADASLRNVVFHGPVTHDRMKELLKSVQLHVFPSRAEGFPKVTLETAAAGVPSLVYGDYGANEWIATGKDGFVVSTIDEMADVIQRLIDHPEHLQALADNARELARQFDWKSLIKDWEREMEAICR